MSGRRLHLNRIVAVLVLATGVFVIGQSMLRSPLTGKPAPDLALRVAAGNRPGDAAAVKLSELHGNPVVLDFWASWCGACKQSTSMLNDLHRAFASRGVVFYGVNVEAIDPPALRDAHRSFQMSFATLHDPDGRAQRMYAVRVLPTVVVIGRDGMVRYASSGVPTRTALRTAISESLLDVKTQ